MCGNAGDGGPATAANIYYPTAVNVDPGGAVYIADEVCRVRQIGADGLIRTVAGTGTCGYSGDGSLAANAMVTFVAGIGRDTSGNLYLADFDNNRIRKMVSVPATVAGAPTNVVATRANMSASVSWTAPADNGSAVTSYTVTASPGGAATTVSGAPPATTATVTGLTNGTSYTFTVAATNSVGTGSASAPSNAVTPATVPDAPTNVVATRANMSASVSWTAPANNGSAVTSYTVTASPGGAATTVSGAPPATSATVSGLTNGTTYTFTVKATNGVGQSPASAPSNAVTPATVPDAPTAVTATRGNMSASVTWTAPANNGSAVTSYTVTASPGGAATTVSGAPPATTATVTGLTNGTSYTFTVAATNSVGTGSASAPSNAVTPATVPDAPTNVVATSPTCRRRSPGPLSRTTAVLSSYTVTASPGGAATTVSGAPANERDGERPHQRNDLQLHRQGDQRRRPKSASAPSNAVTPATVPDGADRGHRLRGNMSASVTWTAPANNGSASYTVTASRSGAATTGRARLLPPPRRSPG